MAIELGMLSQYGDAVSIANPQIVALAAAVQPEANKGAFWEACGAPIGPLETIEFDTYTRSKTITTGTVGVWDDTATTSLPIVTGIKGILIGQVMQIDDEWVKIKTVNATGAETGTISVFSRGTAGTTAASHTTGTAFKLKMSALNDQDIKNISSFSEITEKYRNYAQMEVVKIEYTKRVADLKRQGLTDMGQITQILREEGLIRWFENVAENAIHGRKQVGVENGDGYMSAGLLTQLEDTAGVGGVRVPLTFDCEAGALTEVKLRAALLMAFKRGNPDTIWLDETNYEIFNTFSTARATTREDTEAGAYIDTYNYNGRRLKLRLDADMPSDKVAVVTQSKCVKRWVVNDQLDLRQHNDTGPDENVESYRGSVGTDISGVGYDHVLLYNIA